MLALGPLFTPLGVQNTLLTAGATFGIYAAISLCWMLIIGTAGIIVLGDLRCGRYCRICYGYLID